VIDGGADNDTFLSSHDGEYDILIGGGGTDHAPNHDNFDVLVGFI
jgi:hypothetical protein